MEQKIELTHPWQHELVKLLHDTLVAADDFLIRWFGFSRKAAGKYAVCSECGGDARARAVCRGCYEVKTQ